MALKMDLALWEWCLGCLGRVGPWGESYSELGLVVCSSSTVPVTYYTGLLEKLPHSKQ